MHSNSLLLQDQRSYSTSLFQRATSIVHRENLPGAAGFGQFVAEAEQCAELLSAEEDLLGEIPDEFCDSFTGELMTDPVILPTSHNTLDRSSIVRCLMQDPIDPFNRLPLKEAELQPNVELKAKIEAWVRAKRSGASVEP